MSLDGLRAWIGVVERKLAIRTRVMLVLVAIAIAGTGVAIYLAIDTRESSVSDGDVQALQDKLEKRIDEVAATGGVSSLQAEIQALRSEVEELKAGGAKGGGNGTPEEKGEPSGKGEE